MPLIRPQHTPTMIAQRRSIVAAFACAAFASAVFADTLHAVGGGSFWHHDSGWVFPERIGEFVRVGMPQDVAGSTDVSAHYVRIVDGKRVTASVDVYTADSAINDATFARAKHTLERELASSAAAPYETLPEGTFRVGETRSFEASKAVFKAGDGAPARLHVLYVVDTGEWIVKVRAALPADERGMTDATTDFVRAQRWESLGSAARSE